MYTQWEHSYVSWEFCLSKLKMCLDADVSVGFAVRKQMCILSIFDFFY